MNKVTGECKGVEIDVKRFYVPGVKVETECPTCGSHKVCDLSVEYLGFPITGKPKDVGFYCESDKEGGGYCNTEWQVPVILEISVRLA